MFMSCSCRCEYIVSLNIYADKHNKNMTWNESLTIVFVIQFFSCVILSQHYIASYSIEVTLECYFQSQIIDVVIKGAPYVLHIPTKHLFSLIYFKVIINTIASALVILIKFYCIAVYISVFKVSILEI